MPVFKKILKIFFTVVVVAGAILAVQWIKQNRQAVLDKVQKELSTPLAKQTVSEKDLPADSDPKEIAYAWQYAGKNYSLKETLYNSTDAFYQVSPKSYQYQGTLPANWENDYYGMFFMTAKGDEAIAKIATDLQALGKKNNLSDDQIVELVLAFVQKITYDDTKANIILSGGQEEINYPYETLFTQLGVCSDKSILGAAILNKLGYGTALFVYDAEKHMALGIKCPMQYSNDNSGFCYAETTSVGFRIGMIPDFDQNNKALADQQLKPFNQTQVDQFNTKRLGQAKIFQQTDGQSYNGISKTLAIARQIDALKADIQSSSQAIINFKKQIDSAQSDLQDLGNKMKKMKSSGDIDDYNSQVDKYNNMVDDYKSQVKKYNAMISTYNQKVAQYNSLIKSF